MTEVILSSKPCAYKVRKKGDKVILQLRDGIEEVRIPMTKDEAHRFVDSITAITWKMRSEKK